MSVLKAMPKSDMVKKLDVIFIKMKKLMGKNIGLRYVCNYSILPEAVGYP